MCNCENNEMAHFFVYETVDDSGNLTTTAI